MNKILLSCGMPRCWLGAGLLVAAALLTGCAGTLTTQVTNFHQWPDNTRGATYTVAPLRMEAAVGSASALSELEQKTYVGYVERGLQAQGLVPAVAPQQARLVAEVVLQARRDTVKVSQPVYRSVPWAGFGYPRWYPGAPWSAPFNPGDFIEDGPLGMGRMAMVLDEEIVERPVQVYRLKLGIADRAQATVKGVAAPKVFESAAEYAGEPLDVPLVMPYLVESVFDHFPGTSGQSRRVVFDARKGRKLESRP